MPRVVWNGAISFALQEIPVKLYRAVQERSVAFHLLHQQDGARLRRKLVCSIDGTEVPDNEAARGYEIAPNQHVLVSDNDLAGLTPHEGKALTINSFVDPAQIDPIYYRRPYYVVPEGEGAEGYLLLREALRRSGKVGLGRLVLQNREYLAVLRPIGEVLCLETLYFADELVPIDELIEEIPARQEVDESQLETALRVVDALTGSFNPAEYREQYREAVLELVNHKAEAGEVAVAPQPPEGPAEVSPLQLALEEEQRAA